MSADNLLYEPPGPIARKRNRLISVIGVLMLLVCLIAMRHRLDVSGQFDVRRWEIFLHPGTLRFLFDGLMATLLAAVISMVLAFSLAVPLALARLSSRLWLRTLAASYIGCFRAVPLLLLILFTVILLPSIGLNWSALGYLIFGMVLHHSAMAAEIIRAGILSLGRGQREAALSIGMREHQAMIWIVLPQALKLMLPALISAVLAIVQDTSLGYIIPYEELLRRSQQISSFAPQSLLQSAFIVTVMYGFVSALLLALRRWIERRQACTSRAVIHDESGVSERKCQDPADGRGDVIVDLPPDLPASSGLSIGDILTTDVIGGAIVLTPKSGDSTTPRIAPTRFT